jgi:hypothetical protein
MDEVTSIMQELFELKDANSDLNPVSIFKKFITSLKYSTNGLYNIRALNHDQALITSLFNLATTDKELKLMLFQFLCLAGIAAIDGNDQKQIFQNLIKELGSARNLSYVKVGSVEPNLIKGVRELYPYLEELAKNIEQRVLFLVNEVATPIVKTPLPKEFQRAPMSTNIRTLDPDQKLIGLQDSENERNRASTAATTPPVLAKFSSGTFDGSVVSCCFINKHFYQQFCKRIY